MKFRTDPPYSGVLAVVTLMACAAFFAGCTRPPAGRAQFTGHDHAANPRPPAGLAGLDPEDRRAADAQGFCPVILDERLGEMGPRLKVVLAGRSSCAARVARRRPRPTPPGHRRWSRN